MKIFITGVSGTGKTSIVRELKRQGENALDIDDYCHWETKDTHIVVDWEAAASDEWYKNHEWICDIETLRAQLSTSKNIIVAGHSHNLKEYLDSFDKVFVLTCSDKTITQRIAARTDKDFGQHPADGARILEWNKSLPAYMQKLGAEALDAECPTEVTVGLLRSYFD
ncbi:MAG TPA: AAA family ATPase [Candidatus Paceibacterota bacterium]|jgi:broad-specificity NMP kinase